MLTLKAGELVPGALGDVNDLGIGLQRLYQRTGEARYLEWQSGLSLRDQHRCRLARRGRLARRAG